MNLPCKTECPLKKLGALKNDLQAVYDLNVKKLTKKKAEKFNVIQIEKVVRLFVGQLDFWHLECNECESFPENKAMAIKQFCDFILQVLDNITVIKQTKEGGARCVAKDEQVA